MPYDLKNRKVLITGASRGLGALLAVTFAREGCDVAINYNASLDRAKEVLRDVESTAKRGLLIQGDASKAEDCQRMVHETVKGLGGLDIVIANAGWTKVTPFGDLNALNEDDWDKCWASNTKQLLFLLQAAAPTFNANPDGGHLIVTSSTAGTVPGGSSMAYSVSKAAGLHLVTCLAQTQGPKIRVNAVLPGLLLTEWGQNLGEAKIRGSREGSALKQDTDLQDVVDAFVGIAKNSAMTGVKVRIDSGFMIR